MNKGMKGFFPRFFNTYGYFFDFSNYTFDTWNRQLIVEV